jgi:GT2 family glycosyltransferase
MYGMILWTTALLTVTFLWYTRLREIRRARHRPVPLAANTYDGPPSGAPLVSVLMAAKDEETCIEPAVRSLLGQDYPHFELIVIDDRSRDRTPRILEQLKSDDVTGRLRILRIAELRPGWFGKNNAMREGVAAARGEWLCFCDADCLQTSDRTLSMAVRHATQWKLDFLSLLPRMEMRGFWERVVQPVACAIIALWFNPKRVNDPRSPVAYANGAFMVMSRHCYDAIGGHAAVRTEVNEDIHMARRAKQAGQRLYVCRNVDLYTVRMYASLGAMWRGWSRIFYGCLAGSWAITLTALTLLVMSILPHVSLVTATAVLLIGRPAAWGPWSACAVSAGLAVAAQWLVIARLHRLNGTDPRLAPAFVVGAVLCLGMLINSLLKLGGWSTVTWRGTRYRGQEVVAAPDQTAPQTSTPALTAPVEQPVRR